MILHMKTIYHTILRAAAASRFALLALTCCALMCVQSMQAQQQNKAVLTTADGELQINTDDVQSIRFEGGRIVLTHPWGSTLYNRTLQKLTFLRPLPGMVRLSVNATISTQDSNARRALGLDGDGKLKSTWAEGDVVYVYATAESTTSIGELIPFNPGAATSKLVGDIESEGLVDGQTLYLSTIPRATHTFATQAGTLAGLFYATASSEVTFNGGNAEMADMIFANPQSITKFTIVDGHGDAVSVKSLTITGNGQTVSVSLAEASSDVFVALPQTAAQVTYSFTAVAANDEVRTGTKKAHVQNGKYYTASVTAKLTPVVTAPVAQDLHYNGEAQTLVTAASATGGTVSYKVGSGSYGESLPSATAIGDYTVYYKVTGDWDHHDVAEASVAAGIGRGIGEIGFTNSDKELTYGDHGSYSDMAVTKVGDGSVTYAVTSQNPANMASVNSDGTVTIYKAGTATITATVANGANYDYAQTTATYTLTVNKAAGNIAYEAPNNTVAKTYGDEKFTNTLSKTDTSDGTVTYSVPNNNGVATINSSTGAVTIIGAGTTTVTATVADGTNWTYAQKTATYTLNVSQKALTITAVAKSKTYGDADPALTYTSSGLVGTDAITGSLTRVSGENVGTYAIQQGTLTAGSNYSISYTGANLTVNRAILTAKADGKSRTYGSSNPSFTVTVTGFKNGETASTAAGYTAPTASCSATTSSNVGSYDITASGGSATNYQFSYTNGKLTVNKATLKATAGNNSRTYGVDNPSFTVTVTGFMNGETASTAAGYTAPTASCSATTSSNVGSYDITASGGSATNYTFSYTKGKLTVSKATPVIVMETSTPSDLIVGNGTFTRTVSRVFVDGNGNGTWDNGTDIDITSTATKSYSSSDTSIATVNSSSGEVTPVSSGSATITATVASATNWNSRTATYTVKVKTKVDGQNTIDDWGDGGTTEGSTTL